MNIWPSRWRGKPEVTKAEKGDARIMFLKEKLCVCCYDIDKCVGESRKVKAQFFARTTNEHRPSQNVEEGEHLCWPEINQKEPVCKNGQVWEDKALEIPMSIFTYVDYLADADGTNKKAAWVEDSEQEQRFDKIFAE